ncbi:hypothetical protein M3Y96_00671700 [Aphelenchoides besseyi]|nr:hypothetical protein M3Y96_00671700 [Aphelenchoides besseyi]
MGTRHLNAVLLLFCIFGFASAVVWDAYNYPNPTTQAGAKQCGLRSAGQLCDPDGVLSEDERYRLNHELTRLESQTYQEFGRDFCEKKGLNTVILLAKNVKGGTEQDVRRMATELRQRWNLDQQCSKSAVMLLAVEDRKFWVSRDARVPVYAQEFSEILTNQKEEFQQKRYRQALTNIIQGIAEKSRSKQGQLPAPGPPPSGGKDHPVGPSKPSAGPSFKLPPLWLILAILCIVIPLICCCCCVYFCCCRRKSSTGIRQPGAEDPEAGSRPANQGPGIGDRFRGFLSGGAGGLNNRNRQQPSAPGPYVDDSARGGYVPPRPVAEEGKGLYPSKAIEDEGAGLSY